MITIDKDTKMVVLTGAGVSAESGLKTFRDSDGLWENHPVTEVATPQAYQRDPAMVWRFYKERWKQARQALPNPAHDALARLEDWLGDNFKLITQNVDGLHSRAGNKNVIEMHGSLENGLCNSCGKRSPMDSIDLQPEIPSCPNCGSGLRPDIVWFGEMPYRMQEIDRLLQSCDVFMVVGTSGVVYPAAGFVMTAAYLGAKTLAVNLEAGEMPHFVDEFHQGKAGELLPTLVDTWIRQ